MARHALDPSVRNLQYYQTVPLAQAEQSLAAAKHIVAERSQQAAQEAAAAVKAVKAKAVRAKRTPRAAQKGQQPSSAPIAKPTTKPRVRPSAPERETSFSVPASLRPSDQSHG